MNKGNRYFHKRIDEYTRRDAWKSWFEEYTDGFDAEPFRTVEEARCWFVAFPYRYPYMEIDETPAEQEQKAELFFALDFNNAPDANYGDLEYVAALDDEGRVWGVGIGEEGALEEVHRAADAPECITCRPCSRRLFLWMMNLLEGEPSPLMYVPSLN